jgi:lysophospholipase L1-like esterase
MRVHYRVHRTGLFSVGLAAGLMLSACGRGNDAAVDAILASEATQNEAAASPRAPHPSGIPATKGVIVQAGDSIGSGMGADNWAAIDHLGLPRGIAIHNASEVGKWMLTGLGKREAEIFRFHDKTHTSVLVIQQGTNDLFGGSTAPYLYYNILKPFVALSQKAGFYVAVDTILPRSDSGWLGDRVHEEQRQEYNRLVRANEINADAVNDIAADPALAADPASSLLYADGVHLSRAGQERLAKLEAKTLATLLQYPPRAPNKSDAAGIAAGTR